MTGRRIAVKAACLAAGMLMLVAQFPDDEATAAERVMTAGWHAQDRSPQVQQEAREVRHNAWSVQRDA